MILDNFVDRPVRGEMNEGRLAYGAKVRTLKWLLVDTIGTDRKQSHSFQTSRFRPLVIARQTKSVPTPNGGNWINTEQTVRLQGLFYDLFCHLQELIASGEVAASAGYNEY